MSMSTCEVEVDRDAQDLREDLEQRLVLAAPTDTVRGTFFLGALEAVRALEGEDGVRSCVEAGGEPRFVEFFNYPVGAWLQVNEAAARLLERRCGSWVEAQRQLGRRATADMLKSAAGKALLLLSKGETRRLLANMPSAYRAAVNFGERTVQWEGPTRGRVIMRRDFMPCAWHEGVLLAVLEGMKARAVQVSSSRLAVLDSEYLVSWE
ncbi:DUF2378 family protein [Archangium lansingense]|uniref:DUF2378 family protein n=1 Tax=Archangium lansingense TaxID=2995310 RepID=A0ABT4AP51_9BACT|nr:DUF2378 family protein [Archangium lansinium]MCY1083046.1 DUF2378 family protein [Archangium lansinium]